LSSKENNLGLDLTAPENLISILVISFLASSVHAVSGFGAALTAMPLLTTVLGLNLAAPLMGLFGIAINLVMLIIYRASFSWHETKGLLISAIIGIPLGIMGLEIVPQKILLFLLGSLLISYSTYSLVQPSIPAIRAKGWSVVFGFLAGWMGGAYNAPGPLLITYGDLRKWPRDQFKSNLQGLFLLMGFVVVSGHFLSGNLTIEVTKYFILSIPVILVGIFTGLTLDKRINKDSFQKIVLFLIIALGAHLILQALG
jgi:uncharacterized membrane protein YfcA